MNHTQSYRKYRKHKHWRVVIDFSIAMKKVRTIIKANTPPLGFKNGGIVGTHEMPLSGSTLVMSEEAKQKAISHFLNIDR